MSVLWSIVSSLVAIVLGLILFCAALAIVAMLVLVGLAVWGAIKESKEWESNDK